MATLNRSVSGEGCWGSRNWKRQGNRGEVDEVEIGLKGWMMALLWTTDQWLGVVDGGCAGALAEGRLTRRDEGVLTQASSGQQLPRYHAQLVHLAYPTVSRGGRGEGLASQNRLKCPQIVFNTSTLTQLSPVTASWANQQTTGSS